MGKFRGRSPGYLLIWGIWSLQSSDAFYKQQPNTRRAFFVLHGKGRDASQSGRGSGSKRQTPYGTYSAKFLEDNGLTITTDSDGMVTARPADVELPAKDEVKNKNVDVKEAMVIPDEAVEEEIDGSKGHPAVKKVQKKTSIQEHSATVVPQSGFNVVLTHCTADFDSLASAVGLAKLWSCQQDGVGQGGKSDFDSASRFPTFVVLPRGSHPSVTRFLGLHKFLFPIRSLKSLPSDLSNLNRLGLVDAQTRERIGPAEFLLDYAKRITVVDHHLDAESDIFANINNGSDEDAVAFDYVIDKVGSVSTLIVERLMDADLKEGLSEAEATLLALGIHSDTGSLCYDSTTARDAKALAWVMEQGASQAAIAEHAKSSLSQEQQGVLTQALINTNSTVVHGVTISSVLLTADGFINGLAAVTQDALELSSSDVYLLGLVYEPKPGGQRKKGKQPGNRIATKLVDDHGGSPVIEASAWDRGDRLLQQRLRRAFERKDLDQNGYLDRLELSSALASSGIIATGDTVTNLISAMDTDGDGKIDYNEFVEFARKAKIEQAKSPRKQCTMIIIGRVKAGVNMKSIRLGKLLEEKFGGGGHAKAASATVRLNDESEAAGILAELVNELIETSIQAQPTVGDFMTAPVLSVRPDMTEKQVEDLFTRYDVRALPVVDENNVVIGLVTYKEVAAAKQRMWNKEQKRLRQGASEQKQEEIRPMSEEAKKRIENRRKGSTVKAWMKQHVTTVEASQTMAEVEAVLLENDVGCIPVVEDGTRHLVGMVTRTDLLRQHRYYPSLHYHNKGMSDSIAARKPIIELRRKLKRFDLDE